jgi:hypothetical protein
MWQDSYWHPAADEPLETAAFAPHTGIMVTAFGEAIDGTDVMWDVTDLSRPRRLSQFEGGQPVALSPDGRTVATITYSGQAAIWNVTDPRRPVAGRIAAQSAATRRPAASRGVCGSSSRTQDSSATQGSRCGVSSLVSEQGCISAIHSPAASVFG